MPLSLQEAFSDLEAPRIERHKRHQLLDIIVLTICAVVSGAEGWEAIEAFGQAKHKWLKKWIPLDNGIPSHDCIARVMSRLPGEEVSRCFVRWVQSVSELTEGEIVSIDGKTARRSFDGHGKMGAIHMVSAWANQAVLSLGQVKTQEKSNEITAIPRLLEMLELKGCIVTIDAMGCQEAIAEQIVEKGADYALAVKGNQKALYEAIVDYFDVAMDQDNSAAVCRVARHEQIDAGHGRIEQRRYYLSDCLDTLPCPERWKGLKSIGMVECDRHVGDQCTVERRYYITTVNKVEAFARAVRSHWGVENSLHWVLDVTFREDESRIRKGEAPGNFSTFRQLALNLLKREPSRLSIKRKRFKAALDDDFRQKVIFG